MKPLRPALLALLLGGCTDLLGVAGDCSAEMRELRRERGQPNETIGPSEVAGNFSESWIYRSGDRYTFRWGTSYPSCEVEESRFSRSPGGPPELSLQQRGDRGRR